MLWGNAGVKALFDRALSAAARPHLPAPGCCPVQARIPAAKAPLTPAQAFASEMMPREAHP